MSANADQRAAWNGDSGARWVAAADRYDAVLAPVAERLLTSAALETGERVLDVGCGCGATTLAAAEQVGSTGSAHGVDLSEAMLGLARRRADDRGSAVTFVCADAQTDPLPGPVDVAISRFGTMFFDDPTAAFTNIARHVAPDGRLCIATWQPLAANEWLVVPGAALLAFTDLPEGATADGPGMFAQSDPDRISAVLDAAGFDAVTIEPYTVPLRLGATVDDAIDYLAQAGPGRAMLESLSTDRYDDAIAAVADTLSPHATLDGVILGSGILITTARRRS